MSYIIMRLTTGEQVMATLDAEDHNYIHVSHPLVVKMTPVIEDGRMAERVTAQPFCQFSTDKYYDIPKTCVMFVKPLHQGLVSHYLRIVESYEETVLVKTPDEGKLHWDDEEEEEMTAEDFRDRIDKLSDFLSNSNESEEDTSIIVEGNETIH